MVIAIISPGQTPVSWQRHLLSQGDNIELRVWPELGELSEIEVALCWAPPVGLLRQLTGLKLIASMGAGVEHIMVDPQVPEGIPITRVVDEDVKQAMSQYLCWAVLDWIRLMPGYRQSQQQRQWRPRLKLPKYQVGIMGLGELGFDIARHLVNLGVNVSGWSLSNKQIDGVDCFVGEQQKRDFLSQSHVLINLLPLTPATQGILNTELFMQLPEGGYIINVGRGGHLVEQDLLTALASGQLAGACLDVLSQEPPDENHAFWEHPNITLTPHISSVCKPVRVVKQLLENIGRLEAGKAPLYTVDRSRGY